MSEIEQFFFDKGLNLRKENTLFLAKDELAICSGFSFDKNGKLVCRPAKSVKATVSNSIHSLHRYGDYVLCGNGTNLSYRTATGTSYTSLGSLASSARLRFVDYGGAIILINGSDKKMFLDGNWYGWGVDNPATAPTVTATNGAVADSGTTDRVAWKKLWDIGQNFVATVAINNVVKNITDETYSYVTNVDGNEVLTLNDDIFEGKLIDYGNCDGIGAVANILNDTGQDFLSTVDTTMIVLNLTDMTYTTITAVVSDVRLTLTDDIMDDTEGYAIFSVYDYEIYDILTTDTDIFSGTYECYVTYLITYPNGAEYETGPQDIGVEVTVTNGYLEWTNIPLCPYTGVGLTIHRRLYRELNGYIYHVDTIEDNVTTVYEDRISNAQLQASNTMTDEYLHDSFPDTVVDIEMHLWRIFFITNGLTSEDGALIDGILW